MFATTHYGGKEVGIAFKDGEAWKKVFGPVFVYLNSIPSSNSSLRLWENAKEQMLEEVKRWPYNFTQYEDFPSSDKRGSVAGQLLIQDRYINESLVRASSAYVGVAAPGNVGSWQKESKGRGINLGNITYVPPRNGPTLWEIGISDRSAAEFNVPDPSPTLRNQLYTNHTDRFRQYGLWDRYTDLYPNHDLIYTVGADDYHDKWFFAHVTRNTGNNTYEATTWQILFQLKNLTTTGNYTLQLALASANNAEVQVRFNNQSAKPPHFTTGLIGKDNAIARHGIHGLYWLFSIIVPSYRLQEGNNTIFLTQSRRLGSFDGVMYDYIRLEGPPQW